MPATLGGDHVLHLHGFHDHQRLAGAHRVARRDRDGDHRALQRRAQRPWSLPGPPARRPPRADRPPACRAPGSASGIDRVDLVADPLRRPAPAPRAARRRSRACGWAVRRAGQLGHVLLDEAGVRPRRPPPPAGPAGAQEGDVGGRRPRCGTRRAPGRPWRTRAARPPAPAWTISLASRQSNRALVR